MPAKKVAAISRRSRTGIPGPIQMSAQSKYGRLDFCGSKLVITHEGKETRTTLGERREEIPLSSVTMVYLQKATSRTWLTRGTAGYIRVYVTSALKGISRSRKLYDALYDPHAIMFTKGEEAEFEQIYKHIQHLLSEARESALQQIQQRQREREEQMQQRQRDYEEMEQLEQQLQRDHEEQAARWRLRMEEMHSQNSRLVETIEKIGSLLTDAITTPPLVDLTVLKRRGALPFDSVFDDPSNNLSATLIEDIVRCCTLTLQARPLLSGWPDTPNTDKIAYVPGSRQLVVEYDLPSFDTVPDTVSLKYVQSTGEIKPVARPATQRRAIYTSLVAQLTLRVLHGLFTSAAAAYIDTITFNGYVDSIDIGTGQPVRPCLITVRATRHRWDQLDLSRVNAVACLKVLNASVSKSPSELVPVQPVMELAMVDPRFIAQADVISTLDKRPNLMDLTPSAFEALIANLFEKMGLETRLTQASRDGGVDCVAYDMTPVLGGKVVIQAKRYRNTVGVSAVRDLYGTVQNEGASKGILVTTSGYGKAAFDFAQNKPLTLLDGPNLLYLLATYAGLEAKIEIPESWTDPTPDMPDGAS